MGPENPVAAALAESCSRHRERTALVVGRESWTYARLLDEVTEASTWLHTHCAGRPWLLLPRNSTSSVALLLAGITSGALPVVADPVWTPAELDDAAQRCGVGVLVRDKSPAAAGAHTGGFASLEVVRRAVYDDDPHPTSETVVARFSSGSTGRARCLQFSATAVLAAAEAWRRATEMVATDRVLCLATLNNGVAFNASFLCVLLSGATLAFHPGPLIPRALARTVNEVAPTVLVAFPQVYSTLHDPLTRLRLAVSSAAPLDLSVREEWRRAGIAICDYYGLVEMGPCTFNDGSRLDSVGHLLDHVSCKVDPESRIRLRSPSMAHAFLDPGRPFTDHLDKEGYYVTNDLGTLTDDRRLVLRGRVGRVVNLAGRKVDPGEIEEVLCRLPGVNAAVVNAEEAAGRPVLAAYVESDTLSRAEVVAHCAEVLSPYKIPQRVRLVPRFPRSSAGKVSLTTLSSSLEGTTHDS